MGDPTGWGWGVDRTQDPGVAGGRWPLGDVFETCKQLALVGTETDSKAIPQTRVRKTGANRTAGRDVTGVCDFVCLVGKPV